MDEFKKGIVSVSDILEIANIFVFICGIDAHIGSEISKHFVDVCERDNITYDVIYCPGIFCSHNSINMSSLMLRGHNEVDLSAMPDEPLYALDIIISYQPVNENSPLKLLQTSIQCLRFLYLGDAHMHISYNSLSQLIKIIEDAVSLQEINLNDDFVHLTERSDVGDNSQTLYMDFSRHAKIQTVTLTGKFNSESCFLLCLPILSALQSLPDLKHLDLTERGEDPCNILVETFPSLQNFESLSLRNFNISNGDLVVKSKELRNLYIRKVNFENSGFMLINSCKLEFVIIDDLRMSAAGWSLLFEQLRKQNNLIVLELKDIGNRGEQLHLSNNGQLRKLSVTSLGLPALIVYNGTDPDELILEKVKMPESAWYNLLSAFRFKNLKIIRLTNLDVGHALIDLSQATLLERVSIANVNLCHENTVIKGESATQFPTSNTGWERFLAQCLQSAFVT